MYEMWIEVGSESFTPEKAAQCWEQQRDEIWTPSPAPSSSEAKLVKQSLQALQGLPAAITALRSLAAAFALQAADKTCHNISTLWRLSSSTSALSKLLSQLCASGWHRHQLDRFVDFFLDSNRKKSCPGLLNQAFAAAVRTILHGHSAVLNVRFDNSGAQSLVELYLLTEELRVQLQALTRICSISDEDKDADIEERLKRFPKGAELLSYLYTLLLEPDQVHLDVLRFLFARTYEPYALFVRSCIYCADLKDPHGEFVLEQAARSRRSQSSENTNKSYLKVRSGVKAPVFLVDVCSQMLRTGQQLEVLLKLPETREFAQALSFSFPSLICGETDMESQRLDFVSVVFDKNGLKKIVKQRQYRLETIAEQYRKFFGDKYPVNMMGEATASETESEAEPEAAASVKSTSSSELDSTELSDETDDPVETSSAEKTASCDERFPRPYSQYAEDLSGGGFSDDAATNISLLLTAPDVELPRNPFLFCGDGNMEYVPTCFPDTASSWDIRSKMVNEDSLAKMLIPELAQVGILSLAKATKVDIDVASILLKDDNLPVIKRVSVAVEDNSTSKPGETNSSDEERSQNISLPQGGGSWVSTLKPRQNKASLHKNRQETTSGSDTPISVAVEKSIIDEILLQYRLVSVFTVRLLQDHLHLQEHYLALRRYYFMEVGDWADNFITALCSYNWGNSQGQHHIVEVQGMLETALQKSSCDGDSYAERLHICGSEGDAFINHNSLGAYDSIELGYRVDWPLNLILTPEALDTYKLIFRLLLRVKHAVYALGEISSALHVLERSVRRFSSSDQQPKRYRAFQLFRHQIGHFVTAFQFHVYSQLLHVVWSEFLEASNHEITDMKDLEVVHQKYLINAVHQCFLSPEHTVVKSCMDKILQCLLDFRSSLKNISSWNDEEICSDKLYAKVLELRSSFHENVCRLHKHYLKSEAQYQRSDFWTTLDYNGYFASTC